jgi:hypothetical protein
MSRTAWKSDPTADSAAPHVLAAYDAAEREGNSPVACYCAGVDAWVRAHPDQTRAYAARQALEVILGARVHLRVLPEATDRRPTGMQ